MEELFDALRDHEFVWFLEDYQTACENISWGFASIPFLPELIRVRESADYYDA